MPPELEDGFFRELLHGLLEGRRRELKRLFRFPFVLFSPSETEIITSVEKLESVLIQFTAMTGGSAGKSFSTEVLEKSQGFGGRETYLVASLGSVENSTMTPPLLLRFFLRRIEGDPVIEMIEQVGLMRKF